MELVPDLSEEEWEALTRRLTLYAAYKLTRLRWRGLAWRAGGRAVPGALEPADLAGAAIISALDGTRTWNRTAEPTFEEFMKSVIDSNVNHLATSLENQRTRQMPHRIDEAGDEVPIDPPGDEPTPDVGVAALEDVQLLRQTIVGAIGDDPLLLEVLDCVDADIVKPAEIADLLDVDVEAIYAAKQKMKRVILRADPAVQQRIRKRRRK